MRKRKHIKGIDLVTKADERRLPAEGKKKCAHCTGWLFPADFNVRPDNGKLRSLCKHCEAKRRLVPSRDFRSITLEKTKQALEARKVTNTCVKCGATKGPFTFFRKPEAGAGEAFKVAEAVRHGPKALEKAFAANMALCPGCSWHENKLAWKARGVKPKSRRYSEAPPSVARLAALFTMVKIERRVDYNGPHPKLPKNKLQLIRYGDRIPKGTHTFVTPVFHALVPDFCPAKTPCPTPQPPTECFPDSFGTPCPTPLTEHSPEEPKPESAP